MLAKRGLALNLRLPIADAMTSSSHLFHIPAISHDSSREICLVQIQSSLAKLDHAAGIVFSRVDLEIESLSKRLHSLEKRCDIILTDKLVTMAANPSRAVILQCSDSLDYAEEAEVRLFDDLPIFDEADEDITTKLHNWKPACELEVLKNTRKFHFGAYYN